MVDPDYKLFSAIKENDYTSYNQLFMKYYNRLCIFVHDIVENNAAAEDIVQELFINLWIKRHEIQINKNVLGYLLQASKNASYNYLRSEFNREKVLKTIPTKNIQIDDDKLEYEELLTTLNKCIELLPDRCKEVFLLNRIRGLKQKEIAKQLNITTKTIKNHIWKALQMIRGCLQLDEKL